MELIDIGNVEPSGLSERFFELADRFKQQPGLCSDDDALDRELDALCASAGWTLLQALCGGFINQPESMDETTIAYCIMAQHDKEVSEMRWQLARNLFIEFYATGLPSNAKMRIDEIPILEMSAGVVAEGEQSAKLSPWDRQVKHAQSHHGHRLERRAAWAYSDTCRHLGNLLGSTQDDPTPRTLNDTESNIVQALREAGHRLTNDVLLEKALGKANSHGKSVLSTLVKEKRIDNRQDVNPQGYGLPEWSGP